MRKLAVPTALLTVGATLFAFSIGEIVVRRLGTVEINGQFHLHGYSAKPLVLPMESLRRALNRYAEPGVALEYDSTLGWKPVENRRNSPCLRPDEVAAIVGNPGKWELREFEGHYRPDDYAPVWWRHSRLLSFAQEVLRSKLGSRFPELEVDSEAARITLALLDRCAMDCEEISAQLLILHLPTHYFLERWRRGTQETVEMIRPRIGGLGSRRSTSDLRGRKVAQRIQETWRTARCSPARSS